MVLDESSILLTMSKNLRKFCDFICKFLLEIFGESEIFQKFWIIFVWGFLFFLHEFCITPTLLSLVFWSKKYFQKFRITNRKTGKIQETSKIFYTFLERTIFSSFCPFNWLFPPKLPGKFRLNFILLIRTLIKNISHNFLENIINFL